MLFLVTKHKQKPGFLSRRKAKKGKLPPVITGIALGGFSAARLELFGNDATQSKGYLEPYIKRGDVLIADRTLAERLALPSEFLTEYARRLCVNWAVETLREQEKVKRPQALLIDKEGECVGVAAELLYVCNTVWVATRRPEWFAACAAYTREQYGNQPLFATNPLPTADVVVAPYGVDGWQYSGGRLFGPHGGVFPDKEAFFIPDYAYLPDFDSALVTAGVFAAFHPEELMTALPRLHPKKIPQVPLTL